jgi:hypothetical protein
MNRTVHILREFTVHGSTWHSSLISIGPAHHKGQDFSRFRFLHYDTIPINSKNERKRSYEDLHHLMLGLLETKFGIETFQKIRDWSIGLVLGLNRLRERNLWVDIEHQRAWEMNVRIWLWAGILERRRNANFRICVGDETKWNRRMFESRSKIQEYKWVTFRSGVERLSWNLCYKNKVRRFSKICFWGPQAVNSGILQRSLISSNSLSHCLPSYSELYSWTSSSTELGQWTLTGAGQSWIWSMLATSYPMARLGSSRIVDHFDFDGTIFDLVETDF